MSDHRPTDIHISEANQTILRPLSTLNIVKRYEFGLVSATEDVFYGDVSELYVLNGLNLLKGLNDTTPDDFRSAYTNTLNEDTTTALETFFDQESSTLVSFFALQMIDIPRPFSRSKSMYSISAAVPKLRFINMMTRHGRKAKVSKSFTHALHNLSSSYLKSRSNKVEVSDWRLFYSIFNQPLPAELESGPLSKPVFESWASMSFGNKYLQTYEDSEYFFKPEDWLQNILFDELTEYVPLFSFYVKRVDKLKRKHSRGKSGKYSIVWKYIPKYKRLLTTLRWMTRDVRFQKSKTFDLRLTRSLEVFLFDKSSHLVPQLRQFVHKFVFQHHKKTLLRTLRTSS